MPPQNHIEFDDPGKEERLMVQQKLNSSGKTSKMAEWMVRKGYAKNTKTAQSYMLGLVIVNILLIYFVIRYL